VVASSGFAYTADNLSAQLPGLLEGKPGLAPEKAAGGSGAVSDAAATPKVAAATPEPTAPTLTGASRSAAKPGPSQIAQNLVALQALRAPAVLATCLVRALGSDLGAPLAVDLATFNGLPAVVTAYADPDVPEKVDVYVLDPRCPEGEFVYFASIKRPTPR
jgi:hypothetical protein